MCSVRSKNNVSPVQIQAIGKQEGNVVHFAFRQAAVLEKLGLDPGSRRALCSYEQYSVWQQCWIKAIPPAQMLSLAPGEGVIYKSSAVTQVIHLDAHVIKITPPFMHIALQALHLSLASTIVGQPSSLTPATERPTPQVASREKRPLDVSTNSSLKTHADSRQPRRKKVFLGVVDISDDDNNVGISAGVGARDDPYVLL